MNSENSGAFREWCESHPSVVVAAMVFVALAVVGGSVGILWVTAHRGAGATSGPIGTGRFVTYLAMALIAGVVALGISVRRVRRSTGEDARDL